jgi:hypothetical protein
LTREVKILILRKTSSLNIRGKKTYAGFAPRLTLLSLLRLVWQIYSCQLDVVAALQADFEDSFHGPSTHSSEIVLLAFKKCEIKISILVAAS